MAVFKIITDRDELDDLDVPGDVDVAVMIDGKVYPFDLIEDIYGRYLTMEDERRAERLEASYQRAKAMGFPVDLTPGGICWAPRPEDGGYLMPNPDGSMREKKET